MSEIAAFLEQPPAYAYHVAYQILRNYEDAHDAVAQAVALAWEHAGEYRGEASLDTWFVAIARNVALMEARRRMKGMRGSDEVARRMPTTPKYRAVVRFVYYDGLRQEDAAERMGISYHACRSRLHRARRILEERLYGTEKR